MRDKMTVLAYRLKDSKRVRKPIKYWQCWLNGQIVDENNSVKILRNKYGAKAIYKAVR